MTEASSNYRPGQWPAGHEPKPITSGKPSWYGLRASSRAAPLTPLGRKTLRHHLVCATVEDPPIEPMRKR